MLTKLVKALYDIGDSGNISFSDYEDTYENSGNPIQGCQTVFCFDVEIRILYNACYES